MKKAKGCRGSSLRLDFTSPFFTRACLLKFRRQKAAISLQKSTPARWLNQKKAGSVMLPALCGLPAR